MRYQFIAYTDSSSITFDVETDSLAVLVEEFKLFLLASGFHPDNIADRVEVMR